MTEILIKTMTHNRRYLVQSRGELFQVERHISEDAVIRSATTFKVYKVEFDEEKWSLQRHTVMLA
ncbi:hypothetical protein L484_004146 [Morus notabilis]|uniref:KIB1-4 beta-propeller domain-containing protein n=1 Tax=Morus notabilis TaxID=981085 RepID=W9QF89_9ROSA|nr:hypothetical protein L484_004146 [Morus notabilis]